MKFYTDNNKVMMVQTVASANTFVSSLTGIIKNAMLKVFPKDYFRYVYTDTSETYQEHNKTDLYNANLHKIPYPSLTITPQLSLDNPVGGMKNILMSSPNFWIPKDLNRQYPVLLDDPDGKYKIYFSSDYTTFNIRFKIIVDSFVQATNLGYYLKSRFDDNTFKYLSNTMIQTELPKTFVNAIAQIENLFTDDSQTNKEDLKKLDLLLAGMGRRAKTIVRKKSLNTSRNGYFFEEKSNILTLFTDLDIPEGVVRDNSINGEYEINFRIQVSAWWPNAFIMAVDKGAFQTIASSIALGPSSIDNTGTGFYSISIGNIALDRKNTIYFEDSSGDTHVGINVIHDVINFEASKEPIYTINVANWIWGDE